MFQKYSAGFKLIAVQAFLEGRTLIEINEGNGANISSDSLRRWVWLYENTRSVVNNPDTYSVRGCPFALNEEE
jgi:hypothetical protein